MVKYSEKGEKSRHFNTFLQLHPGEVKVNFFIQTQFHHIKKNILAV